MHADPYETQEQFDRDMADMAFIDAMTAEADARDAASAKTAVAIGITSATAPGTFAPAAAYATAAAAVTLQSAVPPSTPGSSGRPASSPPPAPPKTSAPG